MTPPPEDAPFTVAADFDLGVAPSWLRTCGADVTIRRGVVPDTLPAVEAGGVAWWYAGGRMLIKPPRGVRFLVEGGESVRYAAQRDVAPADVRLFLLGSVWGALALQRGLLPLHASAVGRDRTVHAFTGPPGAGKSTLAAALAARGYPLFTDDMLILDPASFGTQAKCYRAKADLKLWPDASVLTGAVPGAPVRAGVGKRFADPARWSPHTAGRLRTLHCLSYSTGPPRDGAHCRIERLTRRRATFALYDALFRPRQAVAIVGRRRLFESLLAVAARHVQVSVFHRPRLHGRFEEGVACLAEALPARPATP